MTSSQPSHRVDQPARFIVGMPRAATTWLCKCFNEHPDTAAFGESMFFGRRYLQPRSDGTYGPEQLRSLRKRLAEGTCLQSVRGDGPGSLKHITRENLPQVVDSAFAQLSANPTPGEVYSSFASAIASAEGKLGAVEKTPHHLNWLDRIFSAFPDARVVALLREPYTFMLSYKHQGDRKSPQHRRNLERLYHPLACALVWRASMRSALAAKAGYEGRVLLIDQEEIKTDPDGVLEAIQRFFGLDPVKLASRIPPDNTSFPGGARPQLQVEDVFWMNLVARRTMARAGYVRQRTGVSPRKLLRITWSALRLPIWGIGCLLTLRQIVDGPLVTYIMRWFRPAQPKAVPSE